jgi:hypothetical protein
MSRFRAIVAAVFGLAASACGNADSAPPPSEEAAPSDLSQAEDPAPSDLPATLELAIDGEVESAFALARLQVREGRREVHLFITGGGAADEDWVYFDVAFDGIAGSMGSHVVPLGTPGEGAQVANASLDGQTFYSRSGEINLSLSTDGSIEGRFDVLLAPDAADGGEPPVAPEAPEGPRLGGGFRGHWVLACESHLPGHGTFTSGGKYCDELEF